MEVSRPHAPLFCNNLPVGINKCFWYQGNVDKDCYLVLSCIMRKGRVLDRPYVSKWILRVYSSGLGLYLQDLQWPPLKESKWAMLEASIAGLASQSCDQKVYGPSCSSTLEKQLLNSSCERSWNPVWLGCPIELLKQYLETAAFLVDNAKTLFVRVRWLQGGNGGGLLIVIKGLCIPVVVLSHPGQCCIVGNCLWTEEVVYDITYDSPTMQ